ncbi:alpha/beta hydrolase [Marmoricola sp. RAF53]|uniref:alpha/beta hydrolase n=1 Tax=Marmoricola sp. RAF53 TaxID=3233059 RepID=UPI003F981108
MSPHRDHREVTFLSAGVRCGAWHVPAADDRLAAAGRPCAVMAHGFGGTRDTGLLGYAEGFASAGLDVLVFDYRGFGTSEGIPRQPVSYRHQRADYGLRDALRALLRRTPLRTPMLVQVGVNDAVAPPWAARAAAEKAGRYAEVLSYPVDHFDVYEGPWQRQILGDQLDFPTRRLTRKSGATA